MPRRSRAEEEPLDYKTYLQVSWLSQAVIYSLLWPWTRSGRALATIA